MNKALFTDSYKYSHFNMLPPGSRYVNAYIEARYSDECDYVVFSGIQAYIKDVLLNPITMEDVKKMYEVVRGHGLPFNIHDWHYIVNNYDGYLPIYIEAVAEGTKVPLSNVLVQVRNLDPTLPWLSTFVETLLMQYVWYSSSVATRSFNIKTIINKYYEKSGSKEGTDFKLHDFGFRGVGSFETSGIGAMNHLLSFNGTDTMSVFEAIKRYYGDTDIHGWSVPATEHSVCISWGVENEHKFYENVIDTYLLPGKMVAMVIDSYDDFNAVDIIGGKLKNKIANSGGTLIIRLDSKDPLTNPINVINRLFDIFGFTLNQNGYKTLPKYIRVLQGDGMSCKTIPLLIENLDKAKISLDNIGFGAGGGLLQSINRDTFGFAMKASAIDIDGVERHIFKSPKDMPSKNSKKGILGLYKNENGFYTSNFDYNKENHLVPVYRTGEILVNKTFKEVKDMVRSQF